MRCGRTACWWPSRANTLWRLRKRAEANPEAALLLRMRPGEWWLLDREDVLRLAPDAARTTTPIHAKSKGPVPYLFRDQSLAEALQVMGDWPVLPVASRADLAKLEGILTLADTLHAFRKDSERRVRIGLPSNALFFSKLSHDRTSTSVPIWATQN